MKKIFLILIFFNILFSNDLDNALKFYDNKNYKKAYEIFNELCEKSNSRACFSLAYMYENAQGVLKDLQKAYKFYDKSCSLGLKQACSNLALLMQDQGFFNEAILVFNKACKLNDTQSCNTVGLFYEKEKDGKLALSFYKKSCALKDPRACYKIGFLYEKGELIKQNLNQALYFYKQSCSFGFEEACYLLGRYNQFEKNDIKTAKRYFGMACDQKHLQACEAYKDLNNKDIKIY